MKTLKIIINCISTVWIPGIILITKKQFSGYIIYVLFLLLHFVAFKDGLVISVKYLTLYIILIITLSVISSVLYLSKIRIKNNRKLFFIIAPIAFLLNTSFFVIRDSINENRNEFTDNIVQDKIKLLETFNKNSKYFPYFLSDYLNIITENHNYPEYNNWKPGIYCLLNNDTILLFYFQRNGKLTNFVDFDKIQTHFLQYKVNKDTIPFYLAFSPESNKYLLNNSFSKLNEMGVSKINVIYIKDRRNIENNVFDSLNLNRIREVQNRHMKSGDYKALAFIKALKSTILTCPEIAIALDSLADVTNPNLRVERLINSAKKYSNSRLCNKENMIDVCIMLCLPAVTFSVVEYDLEELIKNPNKLE